MLFAIRDDDTSYFTMPQDLENAYDFISHGTISLSVVPKTVPMHRDDVFPYGTNLRKGYYSITENRNLVNYLKHEYKTGRYDILLHGYTHEYKKINNKWIAEMKWKNRDIIYQELLEGKKCLEELFSAQVKVFVAPNNSMDKKTIAAIERLGMDYSGIILYGDRMITFRYMTNFLRRWFVRLIKQIPYPGILDYGKHKELVAYTLDNLDRLKYEYKCCKERNVPFVVYTHYWQINMDTSKKEMLQKLYYYLIKDGAMLVPLSSCFGRNNDKI